MLKDKRPMDQNQVINVLIAAERLADGEQLVNLLRKAGFSLHAEAVSNAPALRERLQQRRWDLLLHLPGNAALPAADLCRLLEDQALDVALVLIGDAGDGDILPTDNSFACAVCAQGDLQDPLQAAALIRTARHALDALQTRRDLRRAQAQLKELQRRYELVLDSATDAIAYLHDGLYLHANLAWCTLFGVEDVEALSHQPFLDLVDDADVEAVRQTLRQARTGTPPPCLFTALTAGGSRTRLQLEAMAAMYDQQSALQIILSPATGNVAHARQLRLLRSQDLVTGLPNRGSLLTRIEAAIAQAIEERGENVLALARLQGFDDFLSLVGRAAANYVLVDTATLLRQSTPADALVAHCGEGEFAVLISGPDNAAQALLASAATLDSRLQALLPAGTDLRLSIGSTFINELTPSAELAVDRARHNLTVRENSSPAAVAPEDPYGTPEQMFQRLEEAFEHEDFILVFQPVVSLKEDGLERYEVRIRLQDHGTLIYPPRFLELANQHGLGEQIDRWVCSKSLQLLQERQNPALKLTLNLTHNSVISEAFLPWLQQQMLARRIQAGQLILQLSELDVISSPAYVAGFCKQLRALDIPLSITHYGCTLHPGQYASLDDADFVKLDKSLLHGIGQDAGKRERLNTTVKSLHARGLLVIAPMIDQIELLPLLWQASVNFVQGNCLQEPSARMDFSFVQDEEITLNSFH
jgi:EAL domain-containing protein (putative c-di-GMP-specific phosphodiesterase class I)/GGDEF domain-containing protein